MIDRREPGGRGERKAFQAEGQPKQSDVLRELQAAHRYRWRAEKEG